MTVRVLLAEDEVRARARMRRLLSVHEDVLIVGEASDGASAVQAVLKHRPDVVFLDVRMPGMDGLTVAHQLRDYLPESIRPLVVFTTAYAEHAVEAFGLESLDYLLKPVERDRLADCLRRIRRSMWDRGKLTAPPHTSPIGVLTGHKGTSLEAIPMNALLVVQVEDSVAFAYTHDGERHRLGQSLAEIEALLPATFTRVSRGAILNTERIDRLNPKDSGTWEAVMEGGRTASVSRRRAKHLRELLGLLG